MEHAAFLATSVSVLSLLAIATEVLGGRTDRLGVSSIVIACISAHAYAVALMTGFGFWPASGLALTCAIAASMITAAAANRATPEMFLLATIAAQLVVVSAIRNVHAVGGMIGLAVRGNGISVIALGWLATAACAIATLVTQRIFDRPTPLAAAYETLAQDEVAARAFGLPAAALRTAATLFHGVLGGIAGLFMAIQYRYVAAEMFDVRLSLTVLTAMYVGGVRQPAYREIFGAATVVALEETVALALSGSTAAGPIQRVATNVLLVTILTIHVYRRRGVTTC